MRYIILFLMLLVGIAYSNEYDHEFVTLELLEIHDGDTIKANILLPLGLVMTRETVRFDYDTWEIGHRTGKNIDDSERILGLAAKNDLDKLLRSGKIIGVPFTKDKRDHFGRLLLKPIVIQPNNQQIDVHTHMKEKGYIRHD